jgi:mycothiol synthase
VSLSIARPEQLDDETRAAVLRLAETVEARDGAPPLSDQALTRLSSPRVTHLLITDGDDVTGYAQLDGSTLEVVGDATSIPNLLEAALGEPGGTAEVRVWSHGWRSPLATMLDQGGFEKVRILHQMRRTFDDALPDVPLPDGVLARAFVVGQDESAWVAVNAAAFASHPEQGSWTVEDLLAREAEAWFDPSGFLVAVRGEQMIGYHWTKVHADGMGEVYVLGVDPSAQGLRLGPALLARGLKHLAERGCPGVLLYVDDDNPSAMRLYERFGFRTFDTDVQWRPARP